MGESEAVCRESEAVCRESEAVCRESEAECFESEAVCLDRCGTRRRVSWSSGVMTGHMPCAS